MSSVSIPVVLFVAVIWFALGMLVARATGSKSPRSPLDAPIWHPHTERPDNLTTAVIAVPDPDEDMPPYCRLLPGIWMMSRDGEWLEEISGKSVPYTLFWWAAEDDLMDMLPSNSSYIVAAGLHRCTR